MFILLIVPVILPATIAAYSVVGERDQGTLEPLLTTPIRREELIIGKGLASFIPAVAMSYLLFFVFAIAARLWATHAVGVEVWRSSQLFAHLVFIPLLATWSIWVALAISARASDVRVAQQLGTLASLPPLAVVSLFAFQVITPTFALAAGLALALLVIDLFGWRLVSQVFDRERLISGAGRTPGRSRTRAPAPP
jgi:ABC-2 type transport system permease protein